MTLSLCLDLSVEDLKALTIDVNFGWNLSEFSVLDVSI